MTFYWMVLRFEGPKWELYTTSIYLQSYKLVGQEMMEYWHNEWVNLN